MNKQNSPLMNQSQLINQTASQLISSGRENQQKIIKMSESGKTRGAK